MAWGSDISSCLGVKILRALSCVCPFFQLICQVGPAFFGLALDGRDTFEVLVVRIQEVRPTLVAVQSVCPPGGGLLANGRGRSGQSVFFLLGRIVEIPAGGPT